MKRRRQLDPIFETEQEFLLTCYYLSLSMPLLSLLEGRLWLEAAHMDTSIEIQGSLQDYLNLY